MTTEGRQPPTRAGGGESPSPPNWGGDAAGPLHCGPVNRPDEYELVGVGHKGGEGLVFRARYHGSLPRAVPFAVKQLVAPAGVDPSAWPEDALVERWREQLKLLHLLRHEHLVGYRDLISGWPPHPAGTCTGEPPADLRTWFLVMEWVEGPSLHQLVRSGRSGLSERATYIAEVASAVEYLHSGVDTAGMVLLHRDIKPGNIIISAERGAVLVDYGLVRVEEPTLTELPAWTGPYLAPEVHADKTRTTRSSDMWALAATAYFALTGLQPSPFDPGLMARELAASMDGGDRVSAVLMDVLDRPAGERPARPAQWAAELVAATNDLAGGGDREAVTGTAGVGETRSEPAGPAGHDSAEPSGPPQERRVWFKVGAVALVLVLMALAAGIVYVLQRSPTTTNGTTGAQATRQEVFQPFDTQYAAANVITPGSGVTVSLKTTGTCTPSEADPSRSDAYACAVAQAGGTGFWDPCFLAPAGPTYLLCFISPSNLSATKVTIPYLLEPNDAHPLGLPWALQLSSGQLCTNVGGPGNGSVDGLKNTYSCVAGGNPAGNLYGDPNRSGPAWTILYQAPGFDNLEKVNIVTSYT